MRSHLCQILAHYVLFLGSQLKLPIPTDAEQFILKTAASRWNKEGLFQWKNPIEDETGFYAEDWLAEEFDRAYSGGSCATVELDSNLPHTLQPSLPFSSDTGLQTSSDQLPLDLNSLDTSTDLTDSSTTSTVSRPYHNTLSGSMIDNTFSPLRPLIHHCSLTAPISTLGFHHLEDTLFPNNTFAVEEKEFIVGKEDEKFAKSATSTKASELLPNPTATINNPPRCTSFSDVYHSRKQNWRRKGKEPTRSSYDQVFHLS
jgi:hypothetical protein